MNKIIFIIIWIFIWANYIFLHENIHRQIAYYHGCDDDKITYGIFESYFECYSYPDREEIVVLQEFNLHSWNEIIGYYIQIIILICGVLSYIIIRR